MVKIEGIFKYMTMKEINGTKLLTFSNSEKNEEGKYNNTYYSIWVNDEVSQMIKPDLKRKLLDKKVMVKIKGWLKIKKTDKYTNMTIYPTEVTEYIKKKNNNNNNNLGW